MFYGIITLGSYILDKLEFDEEVISMKKKSLFSLIMILCIFLSSCGVFGSFRTDDANEYLKDLAIKPCSFLPETIEQYKVNKYVCTKHIYFDDCQEIYLDITVTKEQLKKIIDESQNNSNYKYEKDSYYDEEYKEIVFEDIYRISYENGEETNNVGWADIDKIIYCEKTLNVIFVCFHTMDSYVHKVDEVEYFKRFSIDQKEYVANIENLN